MYTLQYLTAAHGTVPVNVLFIPMPIAHISYKKEKLCSIYHFVTFFITVLPAFLK